MVNKKAKLGIWFWIVIGILIGLFLTWAIPILLKSLETN